MKTLSTIREEQTPGETGVEASKGALLQQLRVAAKPGTLRFRFQHGISWNIIGAIINNGSNFLTNIAIANLLGRELFGQYGMLQSTLATFVGIAQAAGGITATRYVAEFRATNRERAGRVLGLCTATTAITGIVSTTLILLCSPWLATTTLRSSFLTRPLQIAAGVVFFTVVNAYQMGALAGLESYREWAIANGLQGPAQLAICSFLAWRWGLQGAVLGLLATAVIRWGVLHLTLVREAKKQDIHVHYSGIWEERTILYRFALPAALSSLSAAPAIWFGNALLARQTGGYSQLALFSAALNLKSVVMFLPILVNNVGVSLLNNQRGESHEGRYRTVFWANMLLTGSTALVGAILAAVFGQPLLKLYGKTFSEAQSILSLLMCVAVIEAVAMAFYQVIQSKEKMWLSVGLISLPRDLLFVFLSYWLIPINGAWGLSVAYAVAWCVYLIVAASITLSLGLSLRASHSSPQNPLFVSALEVDPEI